eukprot:scaffold13319_cov142-Skeletonema_menzelii.AAC.4
MDVEVQHKRKKKINVIKADLMRPSMGAIMLGADSREGNTFGSNELRMYLRCYRLAADLMRHDLGWPPAPYLTS